MKLNHLKFFVVLSLTLIFGCSLKDEKKPEIRFVDLQGNARSIKTRVPEANAKMMSDQSYNNGSQQSSPEIQNEYLENKKVSQDISSPKYKDFNPQKNNFTPKFTDSDTYPKNPSISQSKVETENKNITENNEPVIEYDLSKEDDYSNKTASKNNSSPKESLDQENENLNSKKRDYANKNGLNSNGSLEYSEEENGEFKSTKTLKKSPKFITSSIKKSGLKTPNTSNIDEEESEEAQTQYIGKSGGKVYVQVGSFLTSNGAKQQLLKSKDLGKGKVLVAYNKQNKRIYRSVYGPFKSKNSASKFRDKVIDSGNEAIIIVSK